MNRAPNSRMRPASSCRASLVALAAAGILGACDQQTETSATAATAPPPAVTVISVQPTDVTPGAGFNGRVVAIDDVQLRARVTGFLEKRLFDEGADVQAGDLLFVIEKAPYQAVVDQRQAELASAEANRVNTAVQLRRGEELVKNKNIPQAEVDERRAADEMAAAGILEAQAALERARIDLGYTDIHAPVAGRISRAALSIGNLVGPDSGVLATIVSQDPIYVTFPVSQRQLLEYRRKGDDAAGPPVVRITLPDGTAYEPPGKVDFFDVQVDPGTDTVTVRAEFANPERVLVDGQFVNVRVERGAPVQMLAVPEASVQIDQAGPYVLVVGGDNKVEARRVTLGAAEGARVVVQEGLKAGDKVIVEGIQKARPGMAVAASEAPPAGPTAGQGGEQPAARAAPAPPRAEPREAASEAPREKAPSPSGAPASPQGEPDDAGSEAPDGQAPAASATPQVEPGAAASQTPSAPRLPEAKPGGAASEPVPQRAQ